MNSLKVRTFYVFSIIAYIVEFIVLGFIDTAYQISILYIHTGLIGLATYLYFKTKNKANYFDFDSIFIVISLIIGYLSMFFYKTDLQIVLHGFIQLPDSFINKGIILYTIGLTSYYLGGVSAKESENKSAFFVPHISNTWLGYLIIILCVFLLTSDLLSYYESMYQGGEVKSLAVKYSDFLIWVIVAYVSIECHNNEYTSFRLTSHNVIPIVSVFVTALLIMLSGSRTLASYYILPIMGAYFMFSKHLSLKAFAFIFCVVVFIMKVVQFTRQGNEVSIQETISILNDLTCVLKHTFFAQVYVSDNGYLWGVNILVYAFAVVPGLSSFVFPNMREVGSAEILTDYIYEITGFPGTAGLGTNIVADLYISFGVLSVICGMYFLGKIVNEKLQAAQSGSIYALSFYLALMAHSAFICRATFASPCKTVAWSLILTWIAVRFAKK